MKIIKEICFIKYCENIIEFRNEGKKHYLLKDILFITVSTIIGNADIVGLK